MSTPQTRRDLTSDASGVARQTVSDWLSCNRCFRTNVRLRIQEEFPSHAASR